MRSVGKKMTLRRGADGGGQTGAKLLLQEPDHPAHALQREAAAAELANDGQGDESIPVVNAASPLASGGHDAVFVPPLQLARSDPSQGHHVVGCELSLHSERIMFQTVKPGNVGNILGGEYRITARFRGLLY